MQKDELLESLRKKGYSEKIVSAFANVKREDFVPQHLIGYAYEDIALPVMEGSTLSQPSTIAFMFDLLDIREDSKILEIGSGSGYALALLAEIAKKEKICGVEIIQQLGVNAKEYLKDKSNVEIVIRNGSQGLPEFAPYDRILVSASCKDIPRNLISQLTENGILVAAVKNSIFQIKKVNGETIEKEFPGFAFVPLVE